MKKVNVRVYTDGFVYCLIDKKNNICRIGRTDKKANGRIKSQLAYYPFPLEVLKISVKNIIKCETYLHRNLKEYKLKADWYEIEPTLFEFLVDRYKKENRGELHYFIIEEWDTTLNRTWGGDNKRKLVHKKDNL